MRLYVISILSLLVNVSMAQQPELTLPVGHTGYVEATIFSPDAKYILSYGNSPNVFLWETNSGKLIRAFKSSDAARVIYAAFSPDGKYIVAHSTNMFNNSLVWNIQTGEIVYTTKEFSYSPYEQYKIFFSKNTEQIIF